MIDDEDPISDAAMATMMDLFKASATYELFSDVYASFPTEETNQDALDVQNQSPTSMKEHVVLFDMGSQLVVCPSCRLSVWTHVKATTTLFTHFTACIFCLLCFWPCACSTYCTDGAKKIDHYCPNCRRFLGAKGEFFSFYENPDWSRGYGQKLDRSGQQICTTQIDLGSVRSGQQIRTTQIDFGFDFDSD